MIKSPNYSKNADGTPRTARKDYVMLHSTVGAFKGAIQWLSTPPEARTPKSWSSAHVVIGRKQGEFEQLMPYDYRAWHAGGVTRKTPRAWRIIGTRSPNDACVGVELANYYDIDRDGRVEPKEKELSEWQYNRLIKWLKDYEEVNPNFKADENHILTHLDTNHYKPNMEHIYLSLMNKLKQESPAEPEHECSPDDFKIVRKVE